MTEKEVKKDLAFIVPEGVEFETNVIELSNEQIERWHDLMHVFFEKLLDGLGEFTQFRWSFNKVIHKHTELVVEMSRRGITHYTPINDLDNMKADLHYQSEIPIENPPPRDMNLTFEAPKNVKKVDV